MQSRLVRDPSHEKPGGRQVGRREKVRVSFPRGGDAAPVGSWACWRAMNPPELLCLLSPQPLRTGPAAPPGLHPDPASWREHHGPTQRSELTGLHGTALPPRAFLFKQNKPDQISIL